MSLGMNVFGIETPNEILRAVMAGNACDVTNTILSYEGKVKEVQHISGIIKKSIESLGNDITDVALPANLLKLHATEAIVQDYQKYNELKKQFRNSEKTRIALQNTLDSLKYFNSLINSILDCKDIDSRKRVLFDKLTPLYKAICDRLPANESMLLHAIASGHSTMEDMKQTIPTIRNSMPSSLQRLAKKGLIKKSGGKYQIDNWQLPFFQDWYIFRDGKRHDREGSYFYSK